MDAKKITIILGLAFVLFLFLSYIENIYFFTTLTEIFSNQFLAVLMLFVHNVLVISLILLGMTFYVNLVVLDFFKREKYSRVVLEHPGTFALVFTIMIIFLSILRGSKLLYGGLDIRTLPQILFMSAPIGIVEGYGIYLTIKKVLSRTMSMKSLVYVYSIFFIAAVIEVAFMNLLISISAR